MSAIYYHYLYKDQAVLNGDICSEVDIHDPFASFHLFYRIGPPCTNLDVYMLPVTLDRFKKSDFSAPYEAISGALGFDN